MHAFTRCFSAFAVAALLAVGLAAAATRTVVIDSGGTARTVKTDRLFVVDSGGATRKVKRLFVIDAGGVARQVYQNLSYQLGGGSLADSTSNTLLGVPVTDSLAIRVSTDGNIYTDATNNGTALIDSWVTPTSLVDTGKWSRWTNTSGAINVGTAGVWQQLNVQRSYGISYNGLTNVVTIAGTLQIAADAGGAVILASASYDLTVSVQEF